MYRRRHLSSYERGTNPVPERSKNYYNAPPRVQRDTDKPVKSRRIHRGIERLGLLSNVTELAWATSVQTQMPHGSLMRENRRRGQLARKVMTSLEYSLQGIMDPQEVL